MKGKSLSDHLKTYIEERLKKKGDEHVTDSSVLKRTCSAVVFTGLTTGSLTVVEHHRSNSADKGLSIHDGTLRIDLSAFPELSKTDGFLWITDSDVIVLKTSPNTFKAYTSICVNWQKKQTFTADNQLRCPSSLEWAFDIHHPTDEEHAHLTEYPIRSDGNFLLIELQSTAKKS
ncbi:hypothetical protein Ctha_0343 [Chloroherpeton thalassium ATCC 35110]|uniref:Uncharacterized protein n=1 Tax=Chloroherpeton thalassium (strain ATCC 35110 / GB-78) TaxID=517418 RepID=B3QU16_CHLT3|nr:hypothetical protein [Chloroherpeton thalassium]ACF12814.1 hypothetical protein Ctha_0343 [Chloroherpeton thalassium ATCC 35110]